MILLPLILLVSNIYCSPIKYTGFSLTYSKDFISEYYLEIYKRAANTIFNEKSFKDRSVSNTLGQLHVKNLKGKLPTFHFTNKSFLDSTKNSLSLEHKGQNPIFSVDISFDYYVEKWNINLTKGHGTLTISATNFKIDQTFHPNHTQVNFSTDATIKSVKISGSNLWNKITDWIKELFTSKNDERLEDYFKKECKEEVVKTFHNFYQTNLFPNTESIALNNTFKEIHRTEQEHLLLTYDTTISTAELKKKLVRHYNDFKMDSKLLKFSICFGLGMISAISEVKEKAKKTAIIINPDKIGLKGRIEELYVIIPRLEEMIIPEKEYEISCKADNEYSIVPLNDIVNKIVQIPMNCTFLIKDTQEKFLSITIISAWRVEYILSTKESAVTINWKLIGSKNLTFDIKESMAGVKDYVMLRQMSFKLIEILKTKIPFSEAMELNVGYNIKYPTVSLSKDLMCIEHLKN